MAETVERHKQTKEEKYAKRQARRKGRRAERRNVKGRIAEKMGFAPKRVKAVEGSKEMSVDELIGWKSNVYP